MARETISASRASALSAAEEEVVEVAAVAPAVESEAVVERAVSPSPEVRAW